MILSQKQSKIVAASDRKNSASSALGIIPHGLCQDERSACNFLSRRMVVCHPAYFIEMLSGLFVNFSAKLLIFFSRRSIIFIEK